MTTLQHIRDEGGLMFRVPSDNPERALKEDGKDHYIVDLTSYSGHGRCDCRGFRINIEPSLSRRANPQLAPTPCKHITRCLVYVGREVLQIDNKAEADLIALVRKAIDGFIQQTGPTLDT